MERWNPLMHRTHDLLAGGNACLRSACWLEATLVRKIHPQIGLYRAFLQSGGAQ